MEARVKMKVRKKSLGLVFLSFLVLLSVMVGMLFTFELDVNTVKAKSTAKGENDIKISVIIPVYKTEKYLDACLKSVTGQTLKDIEIICINDGSPDNCGKILESWKKKDNRVKVIHLKQNKGAYFARNLGLDCAKGKYVTFVDSDDTLDIHTFEFCYDEAEKQKADIVVHNIQNSTDCSQKDNLFYGPTFKCITPNLWACLYKKDLIINNMVRFYENLRSSQDQAFNMRVFPLAKKIVLKNKSFYHYNTQNSSSIMRTIKNADHSRNNAQVTKIVYDDWKKRGYFKKNKAKVEFLKWWASINYDFWRNKSVDKMFVEAVSSDPELFKEEVLSLLDSGTRNKVKSILENSK